MYYQRSIEKTLKRYKEAFPVVALTGPRQSGKSTMLKKVLEGYEYVTFDSPRNVVFLKEDPEAFIQRYNNRVIFDEVQKAPEIFDLIKLMVDEDRGKKGQFVLTGSSQLHMIQSIKESLAGRVGLLTLLPFQYKEIPSQEKKNLQFQGSYPEVVTSHHEYWDIWYQSYISTFVEKDVREMMNIGDLSDFKRLISLLAARVSQVINYATLSRELGISAMTIKRWISVLEASYIIFLLPPYHNNIGKRIIKSPKLYFWDNGIVASLVGIETLKHYELGPLGGPLFENYIISEALKSSYHNNDRSSYYYLRTNHGVEIDLIKTNGENLTLYEIKSGMSFNPSMFKHFDIFNGKESKGYLIYKGKSDIYKSKRNIINYEEFLTH